jgi:hypothetical protein
MSLVKLLSAGKSLVGGQDVPSRYRMDKQMRLPKFVSARNPFAREVTKDPALTHAETAKQSRPQPDLTAARPATSESKRTPLILRLVLATRKSVVWLGKANPFSRLAEAARSKKSAIPCFTKPPIQSELCLDKVQVVRNDLSDADLEVVPVLSAEIKPALEASEQSETAGRSWSRLTTRIFGITQM